MQLAKLPKSVLMLTEQRRPVGPGPLAFGAPVDAPPGGAQTRACDDAGGWCEHEI